MGRVRPAGRVALVGVVVTAALTACGGGAPEPRSVHSEGTAQTEDSTTSPTQTPDAPSPTPSVSSKSEVIVKEPSEDVDPATAAEIEAFVDAYLTAQNEATGNGDFSTVDTMIEESCQVCVSSKQYITRAYGAGGKVEGGIFTEPTITVGKRRGDRILVTVKAVITAYKTTDGSGKVVDQGPAAEETYQYHVSQVDGRWRIVGGSFVG